jgi:hypothetical protein
VAEVVPDFPGTSGRRCINCGEFKDDVICENRQKSTLVTKVETVTNSFRENSIRPFDIKAFPGLKK